MPIGGARNDASSGIETTRRWFVTGVSLAVLRKLRTGRATLDHLESLGGGGADRAHAQKNWAAAVSTTGNLPDETAGATISAQMVAISHHPRMPHPRDRRQVGPGQSDASGLMVLATRSAVGQVI